MQTLRSLPSNRIQNDMAVLCPSIHGTIAFVRRVHAGAMADGQPRWLRSVAVMNLLPAVLPGIKVTHGERQVALLRDVLHASAETETSLLRAGFDPAVVGSVLRLTRFDAGFAYLDHMRVVAESRDLAAKRVAMAALLHDEERAKDTRRDTAEGRARRQEAIAIIRRGLGY